MLYPVLRIAMGTLDLSSNGLKSIRHSYHSTSRQADSFVELRNQFIYLWRQFLRFAPVRLIIPLAIQFVEVEHLLFNPCEVLQVMYSFPVIMSKFHH